MNLAERSAKVKCFPVCAHPGPTNLDALRHDPFGLLYAFGLGAGMLGGAYNTVGPLIGVMLCLQSYISWG